MPETTAAALLAAGRACSDIVGTIASGLADRPVRLAGARSAATTRLRGAARCSCCPRLIAATAHPSILVFIIFYGLGLGGHRATDDRVCVGSTSVTDGPDRLRLGLRLATRSGAAVGRDRCRSGARHSPVSTTPPDNRRSVPPRSLPRSCRFGSGRLPALATP